MTTTTTPSDPLTSLQTTYDQLLTQFFSSLSYLSQRHPLVPPFADPSEPYTAYPNPDSTTYPQPGPEDTDPTKTLRPLRPDTPTTFAASQEELAEDLILKAAQIGDLIDALPETAGGEASQEERIKDLVEKARVVEVRRRQARREMRSLVKRLDGVVMGMSENISVEETGTSGHG